MQLYISLSHDTVKSDQREKDEDLCPMVIVN